MIKTSLDLGSLWQVFKNLWQLSKIVDLEFYIKKRKLHHRLEIQNFSSPVENYFKYFSRSLHSV